MRAIIVGGGINALQELGQALTYRKAEDIIIAVNHAGIFLTEVTYWVSLHAQELFEEWNPARVPHLPLPPARLYGSEAIRENSHLHHLPMCWCPYPWDGGSSALAVFVARRLGARRILLCGVPLENGPHFFDPYKQFTEAHYFQMEWAKHFAELWDVRSMGGWTQQMLGGFDWSWWG